MKDHHASPMGRYEPVTMLGEGRLARAYLAVSRGPFGLEKLVVIRQVRSELTWDRDFLKIFFDEARIAARLNHPNIVQTYEVVEDAGHYLLAMEYLEGQPLTSVLRRMGRANMPREEHLWILTQVLSGLDYAHELRDYDGTPLGVVHRGVSPSNVIITYNGEVKLLDFGMAQAAESIAAEPNEQGKDKFAYGAPELFSGDHVDRRVDIYSVGVMLWEALARKRRMPVDSAAASLRARPASASLRLRDVDIGTNGRLAEICARAIADDPIERYATAVEFLSDIEEHLDHHKQRAGRRDLGSLMAQLFKGDRLEMTKRIDEQIGSLRNSPSVTPTGNTVSPSRAPTVIDVGRSKPPSSVPVAFPPDPPPRSRAKAIAIGAVAVGALAVVVGVSKFGIRSRVAAPSAGASAPGPPAVATLNEPRQQPSPSEEHGRPAQPDKVQFIVKVEPSQATVYLDGKKLGANPFQGDAPRELSGAHVVRATAPGFVTVERPVNFARDFNLTIVMRAVPSTGRAPRRTDESERTPSPRPEPTEVEPGTDLERRDVPRTGRQIDEKDPYSR